MSSTVPVGALVGWMLLLTAKHIVADFYQRLGWTMIERGVGPHQLDVLVREAPLIGA